MGENPPVVSVLLPTFNRADFLPAALDAIRSQTDPRWELIVVDDGSTDGTSQLVDRLRRTVPQPVQYVWQKNAGAYAARNRALDLATGRYVAFFDSDDLWLPQHLADCVGALEQNPDVAWVYGASRVVDHGSGQVVAPNNFVANGRPRPFRRLRTSVRGALHVIDDPRVVECAILWGLYCGLQNSVIRASVFRDLRFRTREKTTAGSEDGSSDARLTASALNPGELENIAEDQVIVIRALKSGQGFGYFDQVHVQYHVHDANSSASATRTRSVERQLLTFRPLVRGFEELRDELPFSSRERRALSRRLAREYFWHIGYAVFWMNDRRADAIDAFRRGLRLWPWSPRCWKTYAFARVRMAIGGGRR